MRRKDREVTDIAGIEEILRLCKTCHVAMVDGGEPYVVPLSFGYELLPDGGLELYFHSASIGKKIDILEKNSRVCFETACEGEAAFAEKTPCNSGYYFASVIGFGEAQFVEDVREKCDALSVLFKHQTGRDVEFTDEQSESVCVFKIVSAEFTGKRKLRPEGV